MQTPGTCGPGSESEHDAFSFLLLLLSRLIKADAALALASLRFSATPLFVLPRARLGRAGALEGGAPSSAGASPGISPRSGCSTRAAPTCPPCVHPPTRSAMLRILGEDKTMVEQLRPEALPQEFSVRADLPQIAFR